MTVRNTNSAGPPTAFRISTIMGTPGAPGAPGTPGTGTPGTPGLNGQPAYTNTNASFTMPAVGANQSCTVVATSWMAAGEPVFMVGAGVLTVNSVTDATHVVLTNPSPAVTGNAAGGTVIGSGALLTPSGTPGLVGPAPPGTGFVTVNAGVVQVTTATDVQAGTNAWIQGISGAGGIAGAILMGDGTHALNLAMRASIQNTPPTLFLSGATGFSPGASIGFIGGLVMVQGGSGGAGQGTNQQGGFGADARVQGGAGGVSTGTAANSNGGNLVLVGGAAGTGGSGGSGIAGSVYIGAGGNTQAFVSAIVGGVGFGIGNTPGADPTITRGTGVPATTQPNGSLFLRTDGTGGSDGLYVREAAAWFAVGGTTTTSATLLFEGQAFQLAAAGSGNGTIQWPQAQATPTVTQAQQANGSNPASMVFLPQAPGAGAASTPTGTPGSFIIDVAAPVSTGAEAGFLVRRAGTPLFLTRNDSGGFSYLYMSTPSGSPNPTNWIMQASSSSVIFNAPTSGGSVGFQIGAGAANVGALMDGNGFNLFANAAVDGGAKYALKLTWRGDSVTATSAPSSGVLLYPLTGSPGTLGLFSTGLAFHRLAGALTISQDTATTDVGPTSLTVAAQAAWASASTNKTGANLILSGGNGATTNGTPGNVNVVLGAPTGTGTFPLFGVSIGGTNILQASWYNGLTGITALYCAGVTPGATNYALLCTVASLTLNAPNAASGVFFTVANVAAASIFPTTFAWDKAVSGPVFTQSSQTTDAATTALNVTAQSAWSGATTNINGAFVNITGGHAKADGTTGLIGGVRLSTGDTLTMLSVIQTIVGQHAVTLAGTANATNLPSGSGNAVVFLARASTVPTVAPGSGVTFYATDAGGGQSNFGLFADNIAFNQFQPTPGVIQDACTTDVVPALLSVNAQSAWTSATTNTSGGNTRVTGGDAKVNGTTGNRGSAILGLGTATASNCFVEVCEVAPGRRVVNLLNTGGTVQGNTAVAPTGDGVLHLDLAVTRPTTNGAAANAPRGVNIWGTSSAGTNPSGLVAMTRFGWASTLVPDVGVTPNTQLQQAPIFASTGRTTTNSGTFTLGGFTTISGSSGIAIIYALGRAITAPTGGAIGDVVIHSQQVGFKNVGGTCTVFTGVVTAGKVGDASMTSSTCVATASTSNFVLTITATSAGGNPTIDWTTYVEVIYN